MSNIMRITKIESQHNLELLRAKMESTYLKDNLLNENICVYACGSLGRLEMIQKTDLDLFFIAINNEESEKSKIYSNLNKYIFFSDLYKINKELGYQEPSKQGGYWDFIPKKNLLDIGSQKEDFNNSFTARMLLILESKPIYNQNAYNDLIKAIVHKYFTDYEEHSGEFYPLFLMNDIMRYWYTLTLNYEYRRDDNDDANKKNWKRLKLKYARLITCFSMLACLYKKNVTPDYVRNCIQITPFERLHRISSEMNEITEVVANIEEEYEWFLSLKSENPNWWSSIQNKTIAKEKANRFHKLVVHELMRVLSENNPSLRDKADVY